MLCFNRRADAKSLAGKTRQKLGFRFHRRAEGTPAENTSGFVHASAAKLLVGSAIKGKRSA
jgi:hypothetical protein